jgi:KDO2-lipid IV(A) lauroyltransferase
LEIFWPGSAHLLKLIIAMLVPLFRFLSIFPLPVLHRLGAALGWLVYLSSPSYRKRLRDNIEGAGFGQHLTRAIAESGKSIVELPFIWCAKPERVARHASLDNWELVQQTLDSGRGIVFLTPHLGCFEIVAQQIALRTPLTVMYRPPRKAALKPLIEGARARHNLMLAPANMAGVRIFAKCLKKGQPIGLLPDQVPQEGEGVWADFFGRAAYTMTLPAKLAQMGAEGAKPRVIVTYAERLPGGKGYLVHFVPFDASLEGSSAEQARAINAAMEQLIARSPAQYFWSYNRYKVPHGLSAPAGGQQDES